MVKSYGVRTHRINAVLSETKESEICARKVKVRMKAKVRTDINKYIGFPYVSFTQQYT